MATISSTNTWDYVNNQLKETAHKQTKYNNDIANARAEKSKCLSNTVTKNYLIAWEFTQVMNILRSACIVSRDKYYTSILPYIKILDQKTGNNVNKYTKCQFSVYNNGSSIMSKSINLAGKYNGIQRTLVEAYWSQRSAVLNISGKVFGRTSGNTMASTARSVVNAANSKQGTIYVTDALWCTSTSYSTGDATETAAVLATVTKPLIVLFINSYNGGSGGYSALANLYNSTIKNNKNVQFARIDGVKNFLGGGQGSSTSDHPY